MGAKCSPQLVQVFSKAELLFDKLTALLKFNLGWIKIDQIDMDQFIDAHVKTVDEYIANFKMIRVKRKEIDKLPDQEKIACCLISFTTFKSQLEDMFNRLSDALLIHLRRNLLVEFKEVDQFLEYASDKLSSRPHTVEEIGNAKKVWKEIDSKKDAMKSTSKSCMDKKKAIVTVCCWIYD
jgi:dynein heavy chain 2